VIANNGVRGRETVAEYAAYGADAVSVGDPASAPRLSPGSPTRYRRGGRENCPRRARRPSRRRSRETGPRRRRHPRAPAGGGRDPEARQRRPASRPRRPAVRGVPRRAVGAREGLELAADGETGIGRAFERAASRGWRRAPGRTPSSAVSSLLVPLVRASVGDDGDDENLPPSVDRVTRETTVDDAVAFYRAFEHVDVAVADPPADADDLDVRRAGRRGPRTPGAGRDPAGRDGPLGRPRQSH